MAQLFHPGEKVMLFYGIADRGRSSIYEIVRSLPALANNERQYQARDPEGYHRVIGDRQIRGGVSEADATSAFTRLASERAAREIPPRDHIRTVSLAGRAA